MSIFDLIFDLKDKNFTLVINALHGDIVLKIQFLNSLFINNFRRMDIGSVLKIRSHNQN